MSDLDLQPIRDRLAKSTPGPWEYIGQGLITFPGTHYDGMGVPKRGTTIPQSDPDADLIAHAPADLAALCDEVERLRTVEADFHRAIANGTVEDLVPADAYRVATREVERLRKVADAARECLPHALAGWDDETVGDRYQTLGAALEALDAGGDSDD